MAVAFTIDSKRDLNRIGKLAEEFKVRGINPRPALRLVSVSLLRSVAKTFRMGGRPRAWEPLAPLTIALRKKGRRSGTPKILRDTGRLFQSITNFFTARLAGVGTSVSYADIHQRGGVKTFPSRQVKVKKHERYVVFGQVVAPFTVDSYIRNVKSKTVRIPRRTFLAVFREDIVVAGKILMKFLTRSKSNG